MPTFNDFLPELIALGQVILVDLVLAGDNAIVVGMAAAGLPRQQRNRAILIGIIAATLLRVIFALITNQLLMIIGLTFAGGILLLWVCWKFWRELMQQRRERLELKAREHLSTDESIELSEPQEVLPGATPGKTLRQAITQIVVADVSMSLDNVLAVAGAAREHTWVLIFGLVLSVGLMGAAATLIAKLLKKYHWIAYIGLAVIFYVACKMIWDGWFEVAPHMEELTDFN
ncbi:MAG: TerC family protein [Rhodospirillaceae bacterium]|nr:MAG: TerC family protein [Rhodospirillaceae bacterium]